MYKPVKDGIKKGTRLVIYLEKEPPSHLKDFVHCFWELKTKSPLAELTEDFFYHILPDACVNLLFNQLDFKITAVTLLQTEHRVLNLGKKFHYVGIQLLPGVWRGNPKEIKNHMVDKPYTGELALLEMNRKIIAQQNFSAKQKILAEITLNFIENKLIIQNTLVFTILENINNIRNISDMSQLANLSNRQLQRKLKEATGLLPHDFLKVIRLQQSFRENYYDYYADQSHFIHSFKKITGYTPNRYSKKFNF